MHTKAILRRLRVGVVPTEALEQLSVGYAGLASLIQARLDSFVSGQNLRPAFVQGEWGSGKSHCLAFIRLTCRRRRMAVSPVHLNARTAPLNYPQRFYSLLAENLQCGDEEPGLRVLLSKLLTQSVTRQKLLEFSRTPSVGGLGWYLEFLAKIYERDELLDDSEWAWTPLLGGDLSWADYRYKRMQALARIQALAFLLRHLGFGGLVVTFDEAETIDQLWNVRSRLVAYDVLGGLCSMQALWCVFGVTQRFARTIEDDISRKIGDCSEASENARLFLSVWSQRAFETIAAPTVDRNLAKNLIKAVVTLYADAYPNRGFDEGFVNKCLEEWARNPIRNPRRLVRLVVHELDLRRALRNSAQVRKISR